MRAACGASRAPPAARLRFRRPDARATIAAGAPGSPAAPIWHRRDARVSAHACARSPPAGPPRARRPLAAPRLHGSGASRAPAPPSPPLRPPAPRRQIAARASPPHRRPLLPPRPAQDKAAVLSDVRGIIAEQLGTDLDKVAADSKFVDLGADSLDTVEIMMALEEKFDIQLDEEGAEKISTVQEAADLITAQIDGK